MRWLITGGCGFIGTSLVKRLVSEGGHQIIIVDNLSVGTREDLANVCTFNEPPFDSLGWGDEPQLLVADIKNSEIAIKAAADAEIIVHLAANTGVGPSVEDPRTDMLNNVIGTFNYLEAARVNEVSRFVFASSGAPVGEVDPPIHEELPPHPVSPYGASKLAGEGYCSAYNKSFGIDTVILRFGNVYGPGSLHKSSVVAKFIRQSLNGETLEIYGDGLQTRDFIYIDDLIHAVLLAAQVPNIGGEAFQIATSRETTVGEMAEMLVSEMSKVGLKNIKLKNTEKRLGDVMRNYSDTSKASLLLGWTAKTHLQDGIKKSVEYFIK
jgi:UDP-glucose 4-epimerase